MIKILLWIFQCLVKSSRREKEMKISHNHKTFFKDSLCHNLSFSLSWVSEWAKEFYNFIHKMHVRFSMNSSDSQNLYLQFSKRSQMVFLSRTFLSLSRSSRICLYKKDTKTKVWNSCRQVVIACRPALSHRKLIEKRKIFLSHTVFFWINNLFFLLLLLWNFWPYFRHSQFGCWRVCM